LSQYICLLEAGIAIPKSLMGAPEVLIEYYTRYGFVFPFIMKDKAGARGQGNYLVHSDDEMRAVAEKHPDRTFIVQEFIPNDGDYRVFVIGGKAQLLIYRTASNGSHLNNISQGGSAALVPLSDLPDGAIAESERAAAIFGRDVAGVDLVLSKADGNYYCFEVNRAPQIEHASFEQEKAQILRDYLLSF
jgi:glutathione synthase/RimK-type ligase-like ATP-grasp enzyme